VLISAIFVAIAALLLGFYFAQRFTGPLIKLTEAAEDISRGDYERRINLDQDDEMGELAKAFNRMARSSAERMTEITVDHNRLTSLFAGMVEGVIDVDEQQRIVHINEVAARLLDIPAAECINQPVWEYVRVIEIITALEQAIETKQVINTQMQRPSADGDTIVDIYVTALRSDTGEAIGALIVLNDISELDHLETIRRDFVANASHELKTPITAIRGLTETILEDPDMDPEVQRDFIQKTHIQSLRLSSLVSDLMTISRLESDEQKQNFQPFDLGAILKSSENAMKLICQEKQLQLEVELPEQEVIINGDFQAISQLIDNLTDNAIKYSNPNGEVSLSLEIDESNAIVRVSDSGIGISPAHQLRIFERFYRVDKARSRELGGTGLGLSIVKNIAESHGGSISLQSTPGVGSIFILQLPLAASA
jgi:two-component system phosphate regulon sensor histidine kinase PhoR